MGLPRATPLVLAAMMACGCAETSDSAEAEAPSSVDARATAHDRALPSRVVVDDFWLDQQIAAMSEPEPVRPKSISLGYAGDSPLSGGVMRDSPMPDPAAAQAYGPPVADCDIPGGCRKACAVRASFLPSQ
ncbi:MAG: hypothetical protein ACRELY_06740 [Polyangiaceae bacterium]